MISVVVPIYNVELYLQRCLESIALSRFNDIEILLVDDGSTDSSGDICDSWANRDSRIRVFHKTNGGLMSAWKYGVNHANGKYVGFVDADDWIDSDMFSVLYENIEKTQSDLVVSAIVNEFEETGTQIFEKQVLAPGVYDKTQIDQFVFPIMISSGTYPPRGLSPNRVTKLYKTELLLSVLNFCDDEVSIGEDLLTTFAYMSKCSKISVVDNFYPYHYRIHSASMIQKYSDKKYDKIRDLHYAMKKVNDACEYDFTDQIANDYIQLILSQMECEILYSDKKYTDIKDNLKKEFNNEVFQTSLSQCDKNKVSKKHKLYIFLLKHSLVRGMVFVRRLKR